LAAANGIAASVSRSDHAHGTPAHSAAEHSAIPISALSQATATINMNNNVILGVATPSAPTDGANKSYVDNAIAGLAWKEPVRLASTTNIAISGLGAIDGVTPVAGDRILCKNHTLSYPCGIYLASAGAWTRTTDADTASDLESAAVFVMEGAVNADTAWVCTNNPPIVIDTTPITFAQFSGAGSFLPDNSVTNIKLADMATGTLKGRYSAGTGDPEDLNVAQFGDLLRDRFAEFREFNVGDGTSTTALLVHNLNSYAVGAHVFRAASPRDTIECDVERPSLNEVLLRFAVAPANAEYKALIVG
jgi:hypothetical protein